jgi:ubiquinone biosynthesis protein UbiJ
MTINPSPLSWLSSTINAYLKLNPASKSQRAAVAGQAITLHLLPFQLTFQLIFAPHEVVVVRGEQQLANASIAGTPAQLLQAACDKNRRAHDLILEGDATLISATLDLFAASQIDWEEQMARFVGDIPAHYAGQLIKTLRQAAHAVDRSISTNVSEYLQEEAQLFPNREEVNEFLTEVDALRAAVDRLEARINQLHLEEGPVA